MKALLIFFCTFVLCSSTANRETWDKIIKSSSNKCFANDTLSFEAHRDVQFILFTRETSQIITKNVESVKSSHFKPSKEIRFIIHGWNNNGNSEVNQKLRTAYLSAINCNVIVVDWGKGAMLSLYTSARNHVNDVGKIVGEFIDFLVQDFNVHLENILLAGHSLGAHIAGVAGKNVKSGKVSKILGLDPAGPLFSLIDKKNRVAKGDADFVEIIHSDIEFVGFSEPIGNVDFYPNWGRAQPGCGLDAVCSHSRSFEYYAKSIKEGALQSILCKDYSEIAGTLGLFKKCTPTGIGFMGGEPLDTKQAEGVYFLNVTIS